MTHDAVVRQCLMYSGRGLAVKQRICTSHRRPVMAPTTRPPQRDCVEWSWTPDKWPGVKNGIKACAGLPMHSDIDIP